MLLGDGVEVVGRGCRGSTAVPARRVGADARASRRARAALDLGAVDGAAAAHDLEAVVLGRVVAGGDHHAAVGLQVKHREIEHRRGTTPTSMTSSPDASSPAFTCGVDARRRDPAVAAERDATGAALRQVIADGAAERAGEVVGEVAVGDAADVVLTKDASFMAAASGHGSGDAESQEIAAVRFFLAPRRSGARPARGAWGSPAPRRRSRPPPDRRRPPRPRRRAVLGDDHVALAVDDGRLPPTTTLPSPSARTDRRSAPAQQPTSFQPKSPGDHAQPGGLLHDAVVDRDRRHRRIALAHARRRSRAPRRWRPAPGRAPAGAAAPPRACARR